MLAPGTRLGPYEVISQLGAGGMGEVYRALDPRLDREVAVKLLPARLEHDPDARARFEREAKAIASLSHPNILSIHDFQVSDGAPFSVTELLEGESLAGRLARGPMSWREAAEVGIAIADGLAAAHGRGIVHRDIKPDNLFLTTDGRIKILDFGLACSPRAVGAADDGASASTVIAETVSGMVLGTIYYMSPEQARGQEVGPPSDLFSLGCVLYEMVTGRRPFERATPTDTLAAILNDRPSPLSGSGRQAPPEIDRVIAHCLEKAPDARFQSARDLAFALRAVVADSGVGQVSALAQRRKRSALRSLAVLPFVTEPSDSGSEYLADGIAEGIINRLSQVPKLRVVPRATVFRYKGREFSPEAAAAELNVDALLTGRVVQRGPALSVQAELVDTVTASQLWGQRYTRENCNCFELEDDLAREITEAIAQRFRKAKAPKRSARGAPRAVPGAEAHREYLKGRHQYGKWTREGLTRATGHFQRAIDLDPTYAAAYAGLGDALGAAAYYGYVPQQDSLARSHFAATRALELDPNLAEAHATMGLCNLFHDWDWPAAERELACAIELDPRFAPAHLYQALYLITQRRFDEAFASARRAEQLDPLSLLIVSGSVWALMFAGHSDEAVAQIHRTLALDADFPEALGMLAHVHEMRGDFEQAVEFRRRWLTVAGASPEIADRLEAGARAGGREGYWRAFLESVDAGWPPCVPTSYLKASVHALLGDADRALEWLKRAYETREAAMVFLAAEPHLAQLRSDPRFADLLARMKLP
jgi:serine/threonine protein kinase/tetratricopeptide (TPR) repeat protein